MPRFRAPDGSIVNVSEEQAGALEAGGYEPVNLSEASHATADLRPETSGALAPLGAAASSALSGATLGLSDLALKGVLSPEAFQRLAADREAHPFVSGAGQLAGTLVGGPTPAGALNEATAAASAGRGVAARIAADAAAGGVYSAGAYLSDSALSDRELSAEGLRAALGAGFEFGAAGGAAALGIEKGTIAARRLFSRLSDGTERVANEAEQAWRAQHQATFEANDAAAELARAKLAEANLTRQQAQLAQQRAAAGVADARAGAPAGASPGAPSGAGPAPQPPLDERIAGVLNDRAHVGLQPGVADPRAALLDQQAAELLSQRSGEATQVTGPSFKPGDPGFRFDYSAKGGGNALDLLGEQPGVVTRGPAELGGRVPGSLTPEAEAELTAALREHDGARAELDDLFARLEAPSVQSPAIPVPVGEFGAPGARGFKSQDELARLAAGTGREDGAIASLEDVTGAGGPRALRGGAKGTPVEQPATAIGKRPDAGAAPGRIEVRARGVAEVPEYSAVKAHEAKADAALEQTVSARAIADRGYYEPPVRGGGTLEEADPVRMEKARKAIAEGQREPVDLNVTPSGKVTVTGGRHRLQAAIEADAPIKVRWSTSAEPAADDVLRHGARSAAPATDTLTGQLRGMQSRLGAGENLAEMGRAPGAAARAEQLLRHPETADRFLAKAEARGGAVAPQTWREFQASKMGEYMRSEGGHAGAMKRMGKEWGEIKAVRDQGVRKLEQAHDAAAERAATATDPAERAAAVQEAQAIEQQLTASGVHPGAVDDVAAVAPVVTRYERAGARLADALGEEAPPAAKEAAQAFRAAEDAADRKTIDRATRAIDDHVEGARSGKRGPAERTTVDKAPPMDERPMTSAADWNDQRVKQGLGDALSAPRTGEAANPRVAAAKAAKLRADAGLAHARAAETEAKIGATTAKRTAAEYRTAAEVGRPTGAAAPAEPSKLGSVLTAVAAAGEVGVPGIPHPKDIPVIGPLLSLWTKYRITKAMVGRFSGRVAATGDARAAAFAARAKDKVAAAVDRTLGLAAEVAPKARGPIVATAAVLGHRLIDDGEPDAPKGANAQELAAVRIREIAAAASRPDLVVSMVRKQLGGVTDPDLIAAAEQVLQQQFQRLAGVMPKLPPPNPYAKTQFVPSPAAAADLADRIGVMHDPSSAFDSPTPAKADALANFYPKLFAVAQQRLAERAAELKEPMTNRQQLVASLIFRVPVATSMEPGRLAVLQSAHVALRTAMQPTQQPDSPPTPAVAQPTNLNSMYQTSADRRAARM